MDFVWAKGVGIIVILLVSGCAQAGQDTPTDTVALRGSAGDDRQSMVGSSLDWLQEGVNAAQTGFLPMTGPSWPDVALSVQVPFEGGRGPGPLVIGNDVYVIVGRQVDRPEAGSEFTSTVHRISLSDASVAELGRIPIQAYHWVSDGQRFFIQGMVTQDVPTDSTQVLAAVQIEEGLPEDWRLPLRVTKDELGDSIEAGAPPPQCYFTRGRLVIDDAMLYQACVLSADVSMALWAVEKETGKIAWSRTFAVPNDPEDITRDDPRGQNYLIGPGGLVDDSARRATTLSIHGLSSIGSWVVASVLADSGLDDPRVPPTTGEAAWASIIAFNREDGREAWSEQSGKDMAGAAEGWNQPPAATIAGEFVVMELEQARVRLLNGTAVEGRKEIQFRPKLYEGDPASGIAASPSSLFLTSRTGLHKIQIETLGEEWNAQLPGNLQWGSGSPVVAGSILYARAGTLDQAAGGAFLSLIAVDVGSGQTLWEQGFGSSIQFAVSGSIIVVWEDRLGTLTVLGETAASLKAKASVNDQTPQPGDLAEVDLSQTTPGIGGPPQEFKAVWGDGTITDWQSNPRLSHRYDTLRDANARFIARNAQGQTASVPVTFYVGQEAEMNFVQTQFSATNQERTFFILGLLLTLAGALYGLGRVRRSRKILDRELRAIEHAYAANREDASRLEPALLERKNHVRGLLAEGKIEQAGFLLLEKRIDELGRNRRLDHIDHDLKFLPVSLFETLREMLSDGRVTEWEHRHFLAALKHDKVLTAQQKVLVRKQIDDWFERDKRAA